MSNNRARQFMNSNGKAKSVSIGERQSRKYTEHTVLYDKSNFSTTRSAMQFPEAHLLSIMFCVMLKNNNKCKYANVENTRRYQNLRWSQSIVSPLNGVKIVIDRQILEYFEQLLLPFSRLIAFSRRSLARLCGQFHVIALTRTCITSWRLRTVIC